MADRSNSGPGEVSSGGIHEGGVNLFCEVPFRAADDVTVGKPLGLPTVEAGHCAEFVVKDAHQHDGVQGAVRLAVASLRESASDCLPR